MYKPDLLKTEWILQQEDLHGETYDVELAVVPWVLTDGNFNRHVEIRGVKAVVKGHKDPFGYCLDYLDNSVCLD
jgi:hypothetical protein